MLDMDALKIYLQELNMQNIWQVERDYMQHVILSAIYSSKEAVIGANLVFKGGTDLPVHDRTMQQVMLCKNLL